MIFFGIAFVLYFLKLSGTSGLWKNSIYDKFVKGKSGVVACTCNPTTLEVEFRNGVGSIPVESNSPWIGGWIVRPPVIQH